MLYPSLSSIVLSTIDHYSRKSHLPTLDLSQFQIPLVVGSNNGYYTGRILFRDMAAFFAVESEVDKKLRTIPSITDVVVVSASGEKHAPIIIETAKKYQKNTFLISSSDQSAGRALADASIIMTKIREPYTYNTSTYFGYMLAENPHVDLIGLRKFLTETIQPLLDTANLSQYHSFFLVIPDEYVLLREMFEVKFIELFGRKIARDIFTYEQMKHATTVVEDDHELFITIGENHAQYGKNQLKLPLI